LKLDYRTLPGEGGVLCLTPGDAPPGFNVVFATKVFLSDAGPRIVDYGFNGDDSSAGARRKLCRIFGLPFEKLTAGQQVHSANVAVVDDRNAGAGHEEPGSRLRETDAMAAGPADAVLAVFTADCVPVLLADPATGASAAVHAGWRGIVSGIVEKTVRVLKNNFGSEPHNIKAFIGPSIGPCCYEIGGDLKSRLSAGDLRFLEERNGRGYLDLRGCCVGRLGEAGVKASGVTVTGACTRCLPELFFSYRGNPADRGSNISFIARTPAPNV
jgi:polyphenol oxidase